MSKSKRLKKKKTGHSNVPSKKPYVGADVIFMYGNPTAIGTPTVPMAAKITSMGSVDGRIVNGRAFTDPGVSGTTPDGRPIQIPSLIPMIGAKYSTSGGKLTWHWRGEVNLSDVNLLRNGMASVEGTSVPDADNNDNDLGTEDPEASDDDDDEEEGAKVVKLK